METILVTGGSGFIGSNFIRHVLSVNPDISIINIDKLTYAGNRNNLQEYESRLNYQFVHGDICDKRLVQIYASKADIVVHFASETHVDRSIASSDDFIQTNVVGTEVLLSAVLSVGRVSRFIHFSTDEVYGPIEEGLFTEDAKFSPTSPYAASKAAADLLVQSYQKTHRFPAIILRGCNNYGPYQFPEKVIPLFVTNLLENKKVPLYSRGENVREWIYVEETCRAVWFLIAHGRIGEAYNVGSGFEISNIDLTQLILKLAGKTQDSVAYVKDRPAHDIRYRLDSSKLKQLGFQSSVMFEEGLKKTVQWYRDNESWWKPLKKDTFTLK